MTLTLTLTDPPRTPAPDGPIQLAPQIFAPLVRAVNTVVYGYVDERIDGSPNRCEELWLTDLTPETMSLAVLHLIGTGDPSAREIAATVNPLIAHACGEQLHLDLVRAGVDGPELRIADDDGPSDPRTWTYRRMQAALAVAGLTSRAEIAAADIVSAATRIQDACIETRAGRDLARLAGFADTLALWNDQPVLVYSAAAPEPEARELAGALAGDLA